MTKRMQKYKTGKFLTILLATAGLILLPACSKRSVPPPPKVQPELLLEIYDASRKMQYDTALQKIHKLRLMDPTNVFLGELENVIMYNRLNSALNVYIERCEFEHALQRLTVYEQKNGFSNTTSQIRIRINELMRLYNTLDSAKKATGSNDLEIALKNLRKLQKNLAFSPKIKNFIAKKESEISRMQVAERENSAYLLADYANACLQKKNYTTGWVFAGITKETEAQGAENVFRAP